MKEQTLEKLAELEHEQWMHRSKELSKQQYISKIRQERREELLKLYDELVKKE